MKKSESIKGVRIFDALIDEELDEITKICHEKKFWKGDVVIRQGEKDESINILVDGALQTEVEIPGFKDVVPVHTLESKEIFGELAFLCGIPRSATVKCLSTARILVLERAKFNKLADKIPNIERIVMRNLAVILSERLKNTTMELRDAVSKLPARIVSRKAKSILSELSDWIGSIECVARI